MTMRRKMLLRWIEVAESRRVRDWARWAQQEAGQDGASPPRLFVSPLLARFWSRERGNDGRRQRPIQRDAEIAYESDLPHRNSLGGPDGWSDTR